MNVIYVGSIYPMGMIDVLKTMGSSIDFAAETFQTSLLQGLCEYYPELKVISAPNISAYPRVKKFFFKEEEFILPFSGIKHIFTGFCNFPGLKHVSKCLRVRRMIKQAMVKNAENTIIIYGVHSPFLLALLGITKKRYNSCLIVPDLPEFMSGNTNWLYLLGKKVDGWLIRRGLRRIDSYVLFSEYMKERIELARKPSILVEGIFCSDSTNLIKVEKEKNRTILYTGSLSRRYGIMDLVEAFSRIKDDNYRLWICGGGDALEEIKKCQQEDGRISYLGMLSKNEVRILQKRATLLINPRHSADEYTKYSFPSKTMEYMASGTPTLMSHLASIPIEYEPYLFFFEDESIDGYKKKMVEICEKPQVALDAFGKAASEFILNEKNEKKQAEKIVELIGRLTK